MDFALFFLLFGQLLGGLYGFDGLINHGADEII